MVVSGRRYYVVPGEEDSRNGYAGEADVGVFDEGRAHAGGVRGGW